MKSVNIVAHLAPTEQGARKFDSNTPTLQHIERDTKTCPGAANLPSPEMRGNGPVT